MYAWMNSCTYALSICICACACMHACQHPLWTHHAYHTSSCQSLNKQCMCMCAEHAHCTYARMYGCHKEHTMYECMQSTHTHTHSLTHTYNVRMHARMDVTMVSQWQKKSPNTNFFAA